MKPINLRAAEVIEVLETGRVTVRREMGEQPDERGLRLESQGWEDWHGRAYRSPFGWPGDKMWVRECWTVVIASAYWHDPTIPHKTNSRGKFVEWAIYRAGWERCIPTRWRSSQHMPRWASRLTLIARDVRAEKNEATGRWDWVGEMERVDE
jgi:hypothetical protein